MTDATVNSALGGAVRELQDVLAVTNVARRLDPWLLTLALQAISTAPMRN